MSSIEDSPEYKYDLKKYTGKLEGYFTYDKKAWFAENEKACVAYDCDLELTHFIREIHPTFLVRKRRVEWAYATEVRVFRDPLWYSFLVSDIELENYPEHALKQAAIKAATALVKFSGKNS